MIANKVLICGDSFASDWSVKNQTANVDNKIIFNKVLTWLNR
jgi:hypothetical protein